MHIAFPRHRIRKKKLVLHYDGAALRNVQSKDPPLRPWEICISPGLKQLCQKSPIEFIGASRCACNTGKNTTCIHRRGTPVPHSDLFCTKNRQLQHLICDLCAALSMTSDRVQCTEALRRHRSRSPFVDSELQTDKIWRIHMGIQI